MSERIKLGKKSILVLVLALIGLFSSMVWVVTGEEYMNIHPGASPPYVALSFMIVFSVVILLYIPVYLGIMIWKKNHPKQKNNQGMMNR